MRKKPNQTQDEYIDDFVQKAHRMMDDLNRRSTKLMGDMRRNFRELQDEMEKLSVENMKVIVHLNHELKNHTDQLTEITRINCNVDETLGNTLLAIRQNQFLQAYYPAQHGFSEMHVTGLHPSKLEDRKKQGNPSLRAS